MNKNINKKAFTVIEYAVLFVIVAGGFILMTNYIQRGMFGSWERSGQSFAYGRQYDAQRTIECSFDEQINLWYDRNCYDALVNQTCHSGDNLCEENIVANTCSGKTYCNGVSN